jgi:hypothetical protein
MAGAWLFEESLPEHDPESVRRFSEKTMLNQRAKAR